MKKISQFQYKWDTKDESVRKPDGISKDSKFSLENLVSEAKQSHKISDKEAQMLSHIIPCCRQDKSKRDYIESLL